MQIKKFQFCAALAATSLQSVMGDSHPDPHGVAIEIGGAEVGHGHGHSHHANKVSTKIFSARRTRKCGSS